ncbi:hypothetical protein VTK73DRAFT_8916 [Phialemonium thermophilum]|uniref:Aminoglycoside phosphotransferase domain-containing protein n=1 Tax=Phialemonium thermophilum TaxID=223376 RepID=A0ABR3W5K4_9PEZI
MPEEPCKFWLGWSPVCGFSHTIVVKIDDFFHGWPNVYRVRVEHNGLFDSAVRCLARFLPGIFQSQIRRAFPGPFLPHSVIVKTKKPSWDEEFENEIALYGKLGPLQGCVVPSFYGRTRFQNEPAFVIEDVGGRHLGAIEEVDDDLRDKLRSAVEALVSFGIEPVDTNNLANVLVAGGDSGDDRRVFMIDFEQTANVEPERIKRVAENVLDDLLYWHNHYHKKPILRRPSATQTQEDTHGGFRLWPEHWGTSPVPPPPPPPGARLATLPVVND